MFVSSKFHNITVSGRAASGATTLSRALANKLGWTLINPGEIYRQYVKEKGIPLEKTTAVSDSYHLEMDSLIKTKLKNEKNLIIESWLSGFDAQGIAGVYKIFVNCSDDAIRLDRIVNRDNMTLDQAKIHLKVREEENLKKWEKIYHTRDIWNTSLYDLWIDTSKNGPLETFNIVLETIGYHEQ
jgi:predicted cytidylate kinase